MLNVSNDFTTAIKAASRRTEALVMMDFGPELTYPFATASVSTVASGYYGASLCDGILNYSESGFTGNYLDAILALPAVGWKGTLVSDEFGQLPGSEVVTITYNTAATAGNFMVVGMDNNYPVDFYIETYNGTWSTVVNVVGNDKPFYSYKTADSTFTKVRVTITKIKLPNDSAHLLEAGAILTVLFNKDDISILTVLEEATGDSAATPIGGLSSNTVDVTLHNSNGRFVPSNPDSPFYGLMRPNIRVRPYIGVETSTDLFEAIPLGVFWTEDWPINNASALDFSFTAFDVMLQLSRTLLPQIPIVNGVDATPTVSLNWYINEVNTSAGITNITFGDFRQIDLLYAFSNRTNILDFYQDVAAAGPGLVNASRENIIDFVEYNLDSGSSVDTWTDDDIIIEARNPQTFNKSFSAIDIYKYNLPVQAKSNLLSFNKVTIPVAGLSFDRIPIPGPMVLLSNIKLKNVVNASLDTLTYGANDISFTISNSTADEIIDIEANGQSLDLLNKDLLQYENSTWINSYEKTLTIDNIYVQTESDAASLANSMLDMISDPTAEVFIDSKMNPAVEIGDLVTINDTSEYLTSTQIKVLRQTINWDGSLFGRVYGRRTS